MGTTGKLVVLRYSTWGLRWFKRCIRRVCHPETLFQQFQNELLAWWQIMLVEHNFY